MNRKALWLALSLSLPLGAAVATVSTLASADAPPAAQANAAAVAPSVVDGRFQRYLVSPRGETMGLLLDGGTVVRVHPDAMTKGAPELKAGDAVRVEGRAMKTPTGQIITHALVTRGADTIADATAMKEHEHHGKKGEHGKDDHQKGEHDKSTLAPLTSTGKIVAIVTGHKGKVAGVVLDDGTTASAGHKSDLGALGLKVGDQVTLTGRGGVYPRGKGMRIEQVKMPGGDSRTLASAAPRHRGHAKI
jgi:hypothetical protein